MSAYLQSEAVFSECKRYRYQLFRKWNNDAGTCCMFIGLNPSTADEKVDDPTVRRCVRFAQAWGFGSMFMMNAYAFRATDPKVMKLQVDPVGAETDSHIICNAPRCSLHVACWGTHIETYRVTQLKHALRNYSLKCLGKTSAGHPKHPLYLAKTTELVDFN